MTDPLSDLMASRHADFVRRFNAADADGIADTFYAPDATILPPNQPPIIGRDAIRSFLRAFHTSASRTGTIKLTRIETSGNLAYVVGTYTAISQFPDGSTIRDHGHLLEAWRRDESSTWWCIADMYVSSQAPSSVE